MDPELKRAIDQMDVLISRIFTEKLPVRICENNLEWDTDYLPWDVEYGEKPHYILDSFYTLEDARAWVAEKGLPLKVIYDLESLNPNKTGEPLKFICNEDPADDCPVVWEGIGKYDGTEMTLVLVMEEEVERCYLSLKDDPPFKNSTQVVDGINHKLVTNLTPVFHYTRLSSDRLEIALW